MNQRAQLMQAVIDSPDDDAVRLVFADWLQDHGEEARAEFIRVQIALANWDGDDYDALAVLAEREESLWREHHAAWCVELPMWSRRKVLFRGGFAASVQGTLTQWIKGRNLCRLAPIRSFALRGYDAAKLEAFCHAPHLGKLRGLSLAWCTVHAERARAIRLLTGTPAGASLRVLDLSKGSITPNLSAGDCVAETLAASDLRPECLELHWAQFGPDGVAALLGSASMAELRQLTIHLDDVGVRALVASPHLGKLSTLDLSHCRLTDEGVALLANAIGLRLKHLALYSFEATADALVALARSPHCSDLQELAVRIDGNSREGVQALAQSHHLSRLRYLRLDGIVDPDAALRELAVSPYLQRLRTLVIRGDPPAESLRALIHSPALPALESLVLGKQAELETSESLHHRARLRVSFQLKVYQSPTARTCANHFRDPLIGPGLLDTR